MLELSDESKRLVSTFLTYRNEIDIYTEDELKDKEFYKVLFTRLLGDEVKISDVTPLGCKRNVLNRCKSEPENGRRKIFIVDGDVTIIHGGDLPSCDNLYVLEAYCVENFLIDRESILQFIYLNCATKSRGEVESSLDFDVWLGLYANRLVDLFIHFALVDYFGGSFTLFNANKFHSKSTYNEDLIDNEIKLLQESILQLVTEKQYEEKKFELKAKWPNTEDSLLTMVSGKDYLIPIVLFKMQQFRASKALPSMEEARFSLAHHCNLIRLQSLKQAILAA